MTELLPPDEKVCPFCAETIKQAAIKCRYCGSELPADGAQPPAPPPDLEEGAAHASPDPVTSAAAPPAPTEQPTLPEGTQTREGRKGVASALASSRTTLALLVLCLLLAVGTGFVWVQEHDPATVEKGPITSSSARDAGLQAAATLTQQVFSYDWLSFDKDAKKSTALMSPSFRQEYSETLAKARDNAIKNQVKQVAKVSSTSVITASTSKVEALVFMNIVTTGRTGTQNLTTSRLVVRLTRDRGEWRISDLEPI